MLLFITNMAKNNYKNYKLAIRHKFVKYYVNKINFTSIKHYENKSNYFEILSIRKLIKLRFINYHLCSNSYFRNLYLVEIFFEIPNTRVDDYFTY